MKGLTVLVAVVVAAVPSGRYAHSVHAPSQADARVLRPAISGTVVDATSRAPLEGAVVTMSARERAGGLSSKTSTDAKGRFVLAGLTAGSSYELVVRKPGYFDGTDGRRTPWQSAAQIELTSDQWLQDVVVTMQPHSSISGQVLGDGGRPVVGAYVRVLGKIWIAGRQHLAVGSFTTTDDRGEYRISGLAAGAYYLQVTSVRRTVSIGHLSGRGR
jgi:hypothetical protein